MLASGWLVPPSLRWYLSRLLKPKPPFSVNSSQGKPLTIKLCPMPPSKSSLPFIPQQRSCRIVPCMNALPRSWQISHSWLLSVSSSRRHQPQNATKMSGHIRSNSVFPAPQNFWEVSQHTPVSAVFLIAPLLAFHTTELYYLDVGFDQVPAESLASQMQDFYISFVNDSNPGKLWPRYSQRSQKIMRLLDGRVGPFVDTVREKQTDFLNQLDVMQEFGRFGWGVSQLPQYIYYLFYSPIITLLSSLSRFLIGGPMSQLEGQHKLRRLGDDFSNLQGPLDSWDSQKQLQFLGTTYWLYVFSAQDILVRRSRSM